eukprot:Colp12_sorted_trinity150504_noHs@33558
MGNSWGTFTLDVDFNDIKGAASQLAYKLSKIMLDKLDELLQKLKNFALDEIANPLISASAPVRKQLDDARSRAQNAINQARSGVDQAWGEVNSLAGKAGDVLSQVNRIPGILRDTASQVSSKVANFLADLAKQGCSTLFGWTGAC